MKFTTQNSRTKENFLKFLQVKFLSDTLWQNTWNKRIAKHGGVLNHETESITWENDDFEEEFNELYDMELDEQAVSVYMKLGGEYASK